MPLLNQFKKRPKSYLTEKISHPIVISDLFHSYLRLISQLSQTYFTGKMGDYLEEKTPDTSPIVVVICGGATVDIDTLNGLADQLGVETKLEKYFPLEEMRL